MTPTVPGDMGVGGTLNICVTGNIASGKSTLAWLASERIPDTCFVPEPHEINPFLPLYLKDQQRWGFTSTLRYFWDYARRYDEVKAGTTCAVYFVDAGTWTNRFVYAEYLRGECVINEDEYAFYQTLCDLIERAYQYPTADGFIFLKASPQTCWERMHRRGWSYQTSAIRPDYIEKLHLYFEAMKQRVASKSLPVLEIDSERMDFRRADGDLEVLRQVQHFLHSLHPPDT